MFLLVFVSRWLVTRIAGGPMQHDAHARGGDGHLGWAFDGLECRPVNGYECAHRCSRT